MPYIVMENKELYHYGILGQKWGVRRYQNEDGSLTPEGRKRYDDESLRESVHQVNQFVSDYERDKSPKPYQSIKPSTNISYKEACDYWDRIFDSFKDVQVDDIFI